MDMNIYKILMYKYDVEHFQMLEKKASDFLLLYFQDKNWNNYQVH